MFLWNTGWLWNSSSIWRSSISVQKHGYIYIGFIFSFIVEPFFVFLKKQNGRSTKMFLWNTGWLWNSSSIWRSSIKVQKVGYIYGLKKPKNERKQFDTVQHFLRRGFFGTNFIYFGLWNYTEVILDLSGGCRGTLREPLRGVGEGGAWLWWFSGHVALVVTSPREGWFRGHAALGGL